jgi:ABC-type transporter MlaC component
MPRLTLLTTPPLAALFACAFLCPTIVAADSSEALTERYIASTFRAMADTATNAPSDSEAAVTLSALLRDGMAVDATARYVLGRDWPDENPAAANRFRLQFLQFVSNALASAFRAYRPVALRVDRSRVSDGRILVESTLLVPGGRALQLTWIVRREGPKGRRRIVDFRLQGIEVQMFLKTLAGTALERDHGNLDAVIALYNRIPARIAPPSRAATTAEEGPTPP